MSEIYGIFPRTWGFYTEIHRSNIFGCRDTKWEERNLFKVVSFELTSIIENLKIKIIFGRALLKFNSASDFMITI